MAIMRGNTTCPECYNGWPGSATLGALCTEHARNLQARLRYWGREPVSYYFHPARWVMPSTRKDRKRGQARTAPLAICRAALAAMERA